MFEYRTYAFNPNRFDRFQMAVKGSPMPQKTEGSARKAEGMGGLAKGLAIVEAFSAHSVMSVADAARAAGATRASARRCLITLTELGYLEHSGREFRPLTRLRRLGGLASRRDQLALLTQPVLVAAPIWSFRSMQRAPRDFFKMLGGSAYGIVLVGLSWLVYSPVPRLIIHNESRAKYRLRDISGTALQYAEKFDGFYPQGSSLLAPAGRAECDSDHLRYLLRPEDGYIFEYHSVVSETSARGCEVAKTNIITARPVVFPRPASAAS